MGLEYRGKRVSEPEDILRLLDVRATAGQVTSSSDAQSVINSGISGLADKSYVDSSFSNYATQAKVDSSYSDRLLLSTLGQSVLQLDSGGKIPPDTLPNMSTRGAVWVPGGTVSTQMDITNNTNMSSLSVYGSWMGGRPYHALGFGQIECKGNFSNSNPVLYISGFSASSTSSIGTGHGIPGWLDWYHITIVPTTSDASPQTFSGSTTFYLNCRSFGASSDFTNFYPTWGVLLIPTHE